MGDSLFTFCGTKRDFEPLSILKITTPKGVYDQKERNAIYESVKEQAGKYYLPIMAPEDVKLEIINEI
ncbi:MAG: hypothetical protein IJN62_00500 [Clostridia bacterium]|nr:hypothetical protein [Clostridia bacterium]